MQYDWKQIEGDGTMAISTPRTTAPDQPAEAAHRTAMTESVASVVGFLVDLLGAKLTAHVTQVDVSTISRWRSGKVIPPLEADRRLRETYQIARLLLQGDADHTVRAWFIGMNPQLDDEAPIEAIINGNAKGALAAARSFVNAA
jgi:hypothetical protein